MLNNMCKCFRAERKITGWLSGNEPITTLVGRCNGTKEREECNCQGNESKCDFYEYVRKRAEEEKKNKLDRMELEFYRDFILCHDLLFEVSREYEEWKKKRHKS